MYHVIHFDCKQAVLKANPGIKSSSKRPNLLMTAGIGVAERDEKKEHLYSLMGQCFGLLSLLAITGFVQDEFPRTLCRPCFSMS